MKRLLYILTIIAVSLLLVGGMVVAVMQNAEVQTALVRVFTDELSRGLNTKIEIGEVKYRFPAKLRLQDVYIEDLQGDTLLYAGEMYAKFHPFALRNERVRFSTVNLKNIRANAYEVVDGEYNYDFIVKAFANDDTTKTELPEIEVDRVTIEDATVRFDDYTGHIEATELSLPRFAKDNLEAAINGFDGYVRHGKEQFSVEDMRIRLIYSDTVCSMPSLYIKLPESEFDASGVKVTYPGLKNYQFGNLIRHKADSINFHLHLNKAMLTPSDLAMIVPEMKNLSGVVEVAGELNGYMDSLYAQDFSIFYNHERIFVGDFMVYGLPDWRNMYMRAECKDFTLRPALIQDFISDWLNKPYPLPKIAWRLGTIHYRGLLKGTLADLRWKGVLQTAVGNIQTDVNIQADSLSPDMALSGRIATRKFKLGRLLGVDDLGTITLNTTAQILLKEDGTFGHIDASIPEVYYRGYLYHDIKLNGNIANQSYDGELTIDDENINIDFKGLADFNHDEAEMDFNLIINHFKAGALNLSEKYADSDVSLKLRAHTVGLHIDSLIGYMDIDSIRLRNGNDSMMIENFELVLQHNDKQKRLRLISDIITARVQGEFDYTTLPVTVEKFGIRYMPDLFTKERKQKTMSKPSRNQLDFYVYGHQLHHLQQMLDLPIVVSDYPVLKGFIDEKHGGWGLHGYIHYLTNRKETLREITLSSDNDRKHANLSLSARWYKSLYMLQTAVTENKASIDFSSLDSVRNRTSHVELDAKISQHKNKPDIQVDIHPSMLHFADSTYHIAESSIKYCVADTVLTVKNFSISSESMSIAADGVGSTRMSDSLRVQLSQIRLGYILPFVVPVETIYADGKLSGWATLYGLFSHPVFEADVRLDSAYLNEDHIGDAIAQVALDRETNNIIINADVIDSTHTVAHLDGLVEPAKNKWELDIYPDSISIAFINHWTEGILDNIGGKASGIVQVLGDGPITYVLARVKAHNGHLTIPFTGCTYYMSDSVFMDSTAIRFENLDLRDEEGNLLHINGILNHFNFKNFTYQIDGELYHTMAINLPDKAGEWIQGKVYADGDVHIKGNDDEVVLSANATSVGKSRFRMSVDGAGTADDNEFIKFTDHNQVKVSIDPEEDKLRDFIEKKTINHDGPKTRFLLGINMDITPELLFQLVINDRMGDMIQGRGEGALRFTLDDSSGDMHLLGTYTLQRGSLGFTVGNLVRREFTLGEGSQVIWNGKPEEPELDVTAKYRVTASLKDLFGDQINSLPTTRTNVPVNTCLSLTGTMMEPIIRFSIELPQSEKTIEDQVRSIINTDEMMMRQVVYLLVFGRFFTPEYLRNTNYTPLNETYSLLSSTVTGQINSWLGKLTNVFTLGFNFRRDGEGDGATQEYEAVFQLQPIDRLVINGNIGYRYNDISNRPLFGDVDVEYMITPEGKVRVRAYTHTVDKYSLRQAQTQQGVGFVFKHDFNWKKDK